MKILIIEDDAASRRFMLQVLAEYGECDAVIDGLEALEAFILSLKDMKTYDLVCLDIMMPKVDGVAVLKAIRDLENKKKIPDGKKVKVIITTALYDQEYVKKTFEIGCDSFLSKPISPERLAEELKRIGLLDEVYQKQIPDVIENR